MRVVNLNKPSRGPWAARVPGFWRKVPRKVWIAVAAVLVVAMLGLGVLGWNLSRPFGNRDAVTLLVIGADEPEYGRSRADTLLLVRLQLRPERRVTLLSVPRDSRVAIPGRKGHDKVNAAFAYGGASLQRRTVTANFGVPIDYVVVSYSAGLAAVVDALGGVDMDVPKAMNYDDNCQNLHIHLKAGPQHLSGSQAVQFVRFRKDGQGDIGRVQRQQTFLKTVARQALNLGLLTRWGRVEPALRQAFQTDLDPSQLPALAYSLRGLAPSELHTVTLPGRAATLHRVSYYLPETGRAAALLGVTPLEESAGAAPAQCTPAPDRWVVFNGTGRNGYGKRAARQLRAAGLYVARVANAPGAGCTQTQIRVAVGEEVRAQQSGILRVLGCGTVTVADAMQPDSAHEVILGNDFQPAPGY